MRKTEASVWMKQSSSRSLTRALRLAVVALGIGIVMTAGAARAGDDDEDDGRSFEDKIIGNIIAGVGGTNMDNRGIDYRERSPLVVPPKLDLPPPVAATKESKVANWPKDPDEKRRKAAIAERKKFEAKTVLEDARPLSPTELNPAGSGSAARRDSDPSQPGNPLDNSVLNNNALGFNGSFGNVFATKPESTQFKGEPVRDSLTQPPVGYQTPSPNYAYGIGTKDSMVRHADPIADSVAGKP
jgi:hypothetical protein